MDSLKIALGIVTSIAGFLDAGSIATSAEWDQADLEDERRPTLTCGVEDLEVLGPPRVCHRTR